MSLHTLILAAGSSSRFGDDMKQLAEVGGRSLLARAVAAAESVTPGNVCLVVGYNHSQLSSQAVSASVLINHNWRQGLGSSIAAGVAQLPASCSGVLLFLCDQVALTTADLTALCAAYTQHSAGVETQPVVCANYRGAKGVPAIFPPRLFTQLASLRGDVGAKSILHSDAAVISIAMPNAATDIDTPAQLAQFILATEIADDEFTG